MKKKGPPPLIQKSILTDEQQCDKMWESTWTIYGSILSKYYNVYELYDDEKKENIPLKSCNKITLDKIIQDKITIDESYHARGNRKIFEKCLCNGKIYAVNKKDTIIEEVKNHLEILVLYYTTYDEAKWQFKIPNVYYRKNQDYVMDFISISSDTWKEAKNHYMFPTDLQYNIGEFLGRYIKTYKKILIEFEIYKDITDDKFVLLDFGEFDEISDDNDIKQKRNYIQHIYDGIKSVLGDDITKIIKISNYGGYKMSYNTLYNKYIKYKTKYLRNLSRKI
jgi:hypothetical protein